MLDCSILFDDSLRHMFVLLIDPFLFFVSFFMHSHWILLLTDTSILFSFYNLTQKYLIFFCNFLLLQQRFMISSSSMTLVQKTHMADISKINFWSFIDYATHTLQVTLVNILLVHAYRHVCVSSTIVVECFGHRKNSYIEDRFNMPAKWKLDKIKRQIFR